jgi:hypothetical protein
MTPTTPLLVLALSVSMTVVACGRAASDAGDTALAPQTSASGASSAARVSRDVTIPTGTSLELALTNSVASDTSAVEDDVTAELTHAVTIDGREALPAGTRLSGVVRGADGSGRVKGRASVTLQFTSLRVGNTDYAISTEPRSHMAEATKSEDATKIGIGAGAGAIIGGILGGKGGAAKGAAVGGGAGTGVVLATKGKEVRLGPGDDVTTQLTSPLKVRLARS